MGKGLFIAFEGIDGAGKTTQLKLTKEWLIYKGYDLISTKEPGGTELGVGIRKMILENEIRIEKMTELLLFSADRYEHVKKVIEPALNMGKTVLCDRFIQSTIAYQHYGNQLPRVLIDNLIHMSTLGIEPDLTLWIDTNPSHAIARNKNGGQLNRFDLESYKFHSRVRNGYEIMYKDRLHNTVKIDGSDTIDIVRNRIKNVLEKYI